MDLSVVTISYNQREYLEKCIDSVACTAVLDYEHIVVDAGSSDGSRELLLELASIHNNIVLVFEKDRGPADGLNKGLMLAKGKYFTYLNSDDEFSPGALEKMVALLEQTSGDVLIGNGWLIDEHSSPIKFLRSDKISNFRYACRVGAVVQQSTMYRYDFLELNHITFNTNNRVSWDAEFLLDAWQKHAIISYSDVAFGHFRMYDATITGSGIYKSRLEEQFKILSNRSWIAKLPALQFLCSHALRFAKKMRNTIFVLVAKPKY